MSDRKLLLVGGGQMGRALIGGMLSQGVVRLDQLRVVDPAANCRSWWSEHHAGLTVTDDLGTAAAESNVVLLAVKPSVIAEVIEQPRGFWDGKLVISIAAGIELGKLQAGIGHQRIVRVMPNTPSLVGAGASGYCGAAGVNDSDYQWIGRMLDSVGLSVRVEEKMMDAVTGLSGSGPAYVCMIIEALADGGVRWGLPRATALALAAQTVLGTAKMVLEDGRHPAELKDAVASPGGTTIAAIASLEQNGLRHALIEAVDEAARQSREIGRLS